MNKERLQKVADAVRKIKPYQFALQDWAVETDCGIVGCAIGHYCLQNPEADLKLEPIIDSRQYDLIYLNYRDTKAACRYFDIDPEQLYFLFVDTFYPAVTTPEAVANRIIHFIREDGLIPEPYSRNIYLYYKVPEKLYYSVTNLWTENYEDDNNQTS